MTLYGYPPNYYMIISMLSGWCTVTLWSIYGLKHSNHYHRFLFNRVKKKLIYKGNLAKRSATHDLKFCFEAIQIKHVVIINICIEQ